ncbi:MAG: SPFH domain-containing protein [bacterium]|nr:SPFH domain-containing protein [bacterium]
MAENSSRDRDLVLPNNQFAFILDETKGHIMTYVGPHKTSLSMTDRPVIFRDRKFAKTDLDGAVQEFTSAEEGSYVVLENPAESKEQQSPSVGMANVLPKLKHGRKINLAGPISFALWPGQIARVIPGHQLRSNQYLIVRVYNEEEAKANWTKAVMKRQTAQSSLPPSGEKTEKPAGEDKTSTLMVDAMPDLTMGKLIIIRGTEVSFYMPPTGIEVLPEKPNGYVRDAVTLERLEYCILLDENGNKRFVKGPDVVFPSPTETFVEKNGEKKFRALELNEAMGLYVKVIADCKDENGTERKAGEELFITGKEQKIYFPCPEHALIRYGDRLIHYAVAIPAGEARYVLDKKTGKVDKVVGPKMFLADPRTQVIILRELDEKTTQLIYPGNAEAAAHNKKLHNMSAAEGLDYVPDDRARALHPGSTGKSSLRAVEAASLMSEDFTRKTGYTPPRTITLDTKYDGAVTVNVWTGYAVMVVGKTSQRRVVVGPETVLLDYDETLEVLSLSTGKPKTTDKLERTVYLRVKHNQVSDIVSAVTKDMVNVDLKLSYRVNFESDSQNWFNVENYVKFLTDHMRSLIRNAIKRVGIEEFNNNAVSMVRDTVLGVKVGDADRVGRNFLENGMRVYDVEVLEVKIGDNKIADMMAAAQHESVKMAIELAQQEQRLSATKRTQQIERELSVVRSETLQQQLDLRAKEQAKTHEVTMASITADAAAAGAKKKNEALLQSLIDEMAKAQLAREKASSDQRLSVSKAEMDQRMEELKVEAATTVEKAKAVSGDLALALNNLADKDLMAKACETMAPMAMLGGKSVVDVLQNLFAGSKFDGIFSKLTGGNGARAEGR